MKKILSILILFISIKSAAQVPDGFKFYAERKNQNNTIDSFYTRFPFFDSVFNKQGNFVAFSVEKLNQTEGSVYPENFSVFTRSADGIYRDVSAQFESGAYTPTLFNTTNVAASTPYECRYLRVGNIVVVSGFVDIDVTAAAATTLGMSLPIPSNLSASSDVAGTGASNAVANLSLGIAGSAANDRALFLFVATSLTNNTYTFQFSYTIR
jgi:hypothetical protein